MKRLLYLCFAAIMITGCNNNVPVEPAQPSEAELDSIEFAKEKQMSSFTRQHLIEHFTGEACGYCPYGMSCIVEGIAKHGTNFIWVSHHEGYMPDEYTVAGSDSVCNLNQVIGAPSMALNREPRTIAGETGLSFHPMAFPSLTISDNETAQVSVHIIPSYNNTTRELKLKVRGTALDTQTQALYLTVLLKENGLNGPQADYIATWSGWQKFTHTRVVRAFLTQPTGDVVSIKEQVYEQEYNYALPEGWNAEHCVAVAYVTDDHLMPIINAAQAPIINGSTGGEEITPGGITMIPIDPAYPETKTPLTDIEMTACQFERYEDNEHILRAQLSNPSLTRNVNGIKCSPIIEILFVTDDDTPQAGTYELTTTLATGTAIAGTRDDININIYGSMYYMVSVAGESVQRYWLLHEGNVVVGQDGSIAIEATTLNNSPVHITYTPQAE